MDDNVPLSKIISLEDHERATVLFLAIAFATALFLTV